MFREQHEEDHQELSILIVERSRELLHRLSQRQQVNVQDLGSVLFIRILYECRCDERLKTKPEKSTRLGYTGFLGELEVWNTKDSVYLCSVEVDKQDFRFSFFYFSVAFDFFSFPGRLLQESAKDST
jgi:hypothetical protein